MHDVPGYGQCKCGKVWNRYVIGSGSDTRTASPEMFIAREVPVRADVIVANREMADANIDLHFSPRGYGKVALNGDREAATDPDYPMHGLMDGVDTEDEANMARWFNRFRDMRRNPSGTDYRVPDVPPAWADENGLLRASALDSQSYVEAEFSDWLVSQGTSLEALKQNPRELQNKLDEFLAQRGGGDPADEILQYVGFFKGAPFAGYDDFEDCTSENSEKRSPDAYCGEIKHRTEDKHAFTNTTGPWSGKTPAGPQGSGVGGLKQKTKYKGVSTPALRALQRKVMTQPNPRFDMNELLRELSFREVLGAIHDITAPGATEDSDGVKNKRTNPSMSAPIDWSRRRSDGKWTRGDGHVTSNKVFSGVPS